MSFWFLTLSASRAAADRRGSPSTSASREIGEYTVGVSIKREATCPIHHIDGSEIVVIENSEANYSAVLWSDKENDIFDFASGEALH